MFYLREYSTETSRLHLALTVNNHVWHGSGDRCLLTQHSRPLQHTAGVGGNSDTPVVSYDTNAFICGAFDRCKDCAPQQAALGIVNLCWSWPTSLSGQFAGDQREQHCSFPSELCLQPQLFEPQERS